MKKIAEFFKPILQSVLQSILKTTIIILIVWKVIIANNLEKLIDKYEEVKENIEYSEYTPSLKYRINDFLIKIGLKEKDKNPNFHYILHDPNEKTQIEIIESNDDTFELIESGDIIEPTQDVTIEDILGLEDNIESIKNIEEHIIIKKKVLTKKP